MSTGNAINKLPAFAGRDRQSLFSGDAVDGWLIAAALTILALGIIMVSSASLHLSERSFGYPWYYTLRQAAYIGLGLLLAVAVLRVRLSLWEYWGPYMVMGCLVMLIMVMLPGIGREVNGSTRWINLGLFNLQVSELAKMLVVVYLAGYLVRRGEEVRTTARGFLKPMLLLVIISFLLLLEPDFGAASVLMMTALGMMFLGGVRLWQFGLLVLLVLAGMAILAISSPYRLERLTTFLNPWADPFASGFQLTQALIAIGRGEFLGVGLGSGVQKLFYLPEAHTDFLFAVMAEEFGLLGSMLVIGLFALLLVRAFIIARNAEKVGMQFGAYLAYGLGLWLGMQAFINIGVNMGVLPTKGLTLPLMSYGGSSIVVSCMAVALLLRVDIEVRRQGRQAARRGRP